MNQRNRRDNASIAGMMLVIGVFAWLIWPRTGPAETSYDSPCRGPVTSYVWPAVTRTMTTVAVVHPEDLDR